MTFIGAGKVTRDAGYGLSIPQGKFVTGEDPLINSGQYRSWLLINTKTKSPGKLPGLL